MIKFKYTILYVENVGKSIEFYNKAFDFKTIFITPENDYGEILTGDTTLSFASYKLANSNIKEGFIKSKLENKSFGIELGFTTENIEEVYGNAIKFGATKVEEISEKPWGQKVAYVRDLDGFLIEICTEILS